MTWSVGCPSRCLLVFRRLYDDADGRYSEAGQWWVVWPLARAGWFPTSTKLLEYASFRELLSSEAVRTVLPELHVPDPFPVSSPPEFPASSCRTLTLDGELAATLWHGGAYHRFSGSAAEAKQLASSAVYELIQDRHEDFRVFYSDEAWTSWFLDIAWDRTWLLIDDSRLEATLLCLTDSD